MDKVLHKIVALLFVLVLALQPTSFVFAETTYTYGPDGQRTKMTVVDKDKGINTTTYYISNSYEETYDNNNPSAPPKIVKHTFANGAEVQTVFDSGKDAKTYDVLTDPLGNVTGLADSTGKLVETTDYYPFGAIRVDNKIDPAVPSSPNKFLDQKYDEQTGLNYLNARYYNSAIGRFISQDPVSLATPEKLLEDPQQLNFYSYARNNPITLSDPTGLKVELISRPVFDIGGHIIGSHVFWLVKPDRPDEINIDGLASGTKEFTMGGYQSNSNPISNKLIKQIGTTETSKDKKWAFGGGSIMNSAVINPLDKQDDTQLINNLGKTYNDINLTGMNYRFAGNYQGLYDGNSNNFAYTLGVKAGLKDQMDAFHPNPKAIIGGVAPGYGTMLPTTSVYRQIRASVISIAKQVATLFNNLKNK